ncbi:hypothetical protein LCGC14_3092480 [marine sediment metagenome]|uniref:Uncharacterized protein n=1 Tax=marine sediment metagenome TaxID=412755 RepID=A0A0F8Z0G2_9ZZZZ
MGPERVQRLLESGALNSPEAMKAFQAFLDYQYWDSLWGGLGVWSFFMTLLVAICIVVWKAN